MFETVTQLTQEETLNLILLGLSSVGGSKPVCLLGFINSWSLGWQLLVLLLTCTGCLSLIAKTRCPSLHFVIYSLLQSLIHQSHTLNKQVLCFAGFLHHLEVFVKPDEVLLQVSTLHHGIGRRHVNPQVENTRLSLLSGF